MHVFRHGQYHHGASFQRTTKNTKGAMRNTKGERRNATLGIDFNDTTQAARIDLVIGGRAHTVNLACPTGEMLRPLVMPAITFSDEQVE